VTVFHSINPSMSQFIDLSVSNLIMQTIVQSANSWKITRNIYPCCRFRTIRRSGIFRRICGDTLISQPQEEGTTFHSVDQNAVSPLLTVLFIGILVSIFMLIVERKYSHSQHCRYHKYALHVRFVGTHTTPSTKALH
jgi:hypothetical protein